MAEVVSAEAWHQAFVDGRGRSDLHADVVFGIGRIGGGDPSGVRFRLASRRAQVIVVVPEREPAAIDLATVRRDASKPVAGKVETRAGSRQGALPYQRR
jgi:hypothetical protein